ncbi:MAG: O-antigen ligase family protein [Clostridia bacterium]|nr:O-antigen ligase family protein [Clostridia bacterium]
MGYGAILRERFPIIKFLVNAQKTVWYPILFAVLCIISGSNGREVYIPLICILCSFVLFSLIFSDDNKVLLVPILMIYYSLGMDNPMARPGGTDGDSLLSSFDFDSFITIISMGVVVFCAFIARLIADGSIKTALKRSKVGMVGILALDAAFMLNGVFSPNYQAMNLLYGFIISAAITIFYFACIGMMKNSRDVVVYACKTMVCTAYVALIQFFIKAYWVFEDGNLFILNAESEIVRINRTYLNLAWGLSTQIAAVFVLGIPAALYLARNRKYSVLSYVSAFMFLIGTVIINTRSAMLVGVAAFLICSVLCCLKNKNHPANAIYCRVLFFVFLAFSSYVVIKLLCIPSGFDEILYYLRLGNYNDSARLKIWARGWQHFLQSPVFGSGFDTGSNISNNVFSSMYHCIIVQFFASMGVFGVVAFAVHGVSFGTVFFKKISINKVLLLFVPLMILGMSLVDNFFFYPNSQIFYAVFLALAEFYMGSDGEEDRNGALFHTL